LLYSIDADKVLTYAACLANLVDLPYLSTLNLSATKVTTTGLAKIIADAEWKSNLQTLDLSYCQGIAGPLALYNLQGNLPVQPSAALFSLFSHFLFPLISRLFVEIQKSWLTFT
jgi:hypothetical protein